MFFFFDYEFIFSGDHLLLQKPSLRASSPGRSGAAVEKGRRACNYVSGIWVSASKKSKRNADWRKSDSSVDREPQGNWRWNSNFRDAVASSPSSVCQSAPESLLAGKQKPLTPTTGFTTGFFRPLLRLRWWRLETGCCYLNYCTMELFMASQFGTSLLLFPGQLCYSRWKKRWRP